MDRQKIVSLHGEKAIIDNNIICDFAELDCIELLNKVFSKVFIPQSILDREVIQFRSALERLDYEAAVIEEFETYVFMDKILNEHGGLTECDAEVIAIAYESYVLCTSNEKRVMTTCKENEIRYTGTIGILCCAYEHMIISREDLSRLINALQNDCTCFLSARLVEDVKKEYEL